MMAAFMISAGSDMTPAAAISAAVEAGYLSPVVGRAAALRALRGARGDGYALAALPTRAVVIIRAGQVLATIPAATATATANR